MTRPAHEGGRQKFRVVHLLRGAGELKHEMGRRKRDDVVGRFVVVEIVVIVLDEEHRRRSEFSAIDRGDLRPGGTLEHALVVATEHDPGAVELAGDPFGLGRRSVALRGERRQQVPIDMIAVGDRRLRRKAQAAAEQPIAHRRR